MSEAFQRCQNKHNLYLFWEVSQQAELFFFLFLERHPVHTDASQRYKQTRLCLSSAVQFSKCLERNASRETITPLCLFLFVWKKQGGKCLCFKYLGQSTIWGINGFPDLSYQSKMIIFRWMTSRISPRVWNYLLHLADRCWVQLFLLFSFQHWKILCCGWALNSKAFCWWWC